MKILIFINKHKLSIFILMFIFTSVSLMMQHFVFQTNAYDLGIEAGTARNIVFNRSFYDPVMRMNLLGDHFEPALALVGLCFYLWDNAAVVILFQNICVFLGLLIAFLLAKSILKNEIKAILVTMILCFCYYLQATNRFPFHIEVLAFPIFLFMLLKLEEKSKSTLFLISLLSLALLTIKEDVSLTLSIFGLWVILFKKGKRLEGLSMFLIGAIGFYVIIKYIMPYFSDGVYTHLGRYTNLGQNPQEILHTLFLRPIVIVKNIFISEKITSILLLFAWFGFLPVLAPKYILAGLSPILYNIISCYPSQYRFEAHYSITLLPFLFYASVYGLYNLESVLHRITNIKVNALIKKLGVIWICLVLIAGVAVNAKYINPFLESKDLRQYYILEHKIKPLLPKNSNIIATSDLQPHFVNYMATMFTPHMDYPVDENTYFLLTSNTPWPWQIDEYNDCVAKIKQDNLIVYQDQKFLVIKQL